MNKLPSYATQYGKILDAYMKDEIKPFEPEFCFCGTLAPITDAWSDSESTWKTTDYAFHEFEQMEEALLCTIDKETQNTGEIMYAAALQNGKLDFKKDHPNYENALFNGMSAALSVLKEIHEAHGEVIDAPPVLPIRSLQLV